MSQTMEVSGLVQPSPHPSVPEFKFQKRPMHTGISSQLYSSDSLVGVNTSSIYKQLGCFLSLSQRKPHIKIKTKLELSVIDTSEGYRPQLVLRGRKNISMLREVSTPETPWFSCWALCPTLWGLYEDDMGSTFFKLFILFIFKIKVPNLVQLSEQENSKLSRSLHTCTQNRPHLIEQL